MTEEEMQDVRLQCLHMATKLVSEDGCYEYVIDAAKAYIDFVFKSKTPQLRVAENEDGGDIA